MKERQHGQNQATNTFLTGKQFSPMVSGKSTLARLAARFWDPTQGTVLLDNQDLRQYTLSQVRACFSLVDQETYLFNDTLCNNLPLGKPAASADEDERFNTSAHFWRKPLP